MARAFFRSSISLLKSATLRSCGVIASKDQETERATYCDRFVETVVLGEKKKRKFVERYSPASPRPPHDSALVLGALL